MCRIMCKSFVFLLSAVAFAIAAVDLRGQGRQVQIDDIVARGERVFSVDVVSNDENLRNLLRRAFRTHGQFSLAENRSRADFVFEVVVQGENRVRLRIQSGSPLQTLHEESVSGDTVRQAALRAGDVAVRRTTGLPGYFSGRLTFIGQQSGHREVYMSDLFLGERRQLTTDRSKSVSPRWSPDGRRIIYTGYYRSGFPDIFVIDTAGMRRTPLVTFRGTNTGARFSPDGSRISMVLSGEGTPEVYVADSSARNARRLTRTGGSVQSSPTWSPNGRELIFVSDRDGRPQLYRMTAEGENMRRIPTDISRYCAEPDWNPVNPNQIAFTAAVAGRFAVAVYDFSTRQSRFVTQGPQDAIEPRWTNDGRHLIYTLRSANQEVLAILDTVTGKSTPLSDGSLGRLSQADFLMP